MKTVFFENSSAPFPDVNSQSKEENRPEDAEPSQDDAGDGHAFSPNAQRIAANLAEPQIAENHGSHRTNPRYPQETADEAA